MTTQELIKKLQKMPPDAHVRHIWDGAPYTEIEHVWLSPSGEVMTADRNEVVYDTSARPVGAPTEEQVPYWCTPEGWQTW